MMMQMMYQKQMESMMASVNGVPAQQQRAAENLVQSQSLNQDGKVQQLAEQNDQL